MRCEYKRGSDVRGGMTMTSVVPTRFSITEVLGDNHCNIRGPCGVKVLLPITSKLYIISNMEKTCNQQRTNVAYLFIAIEICTVLFELVVDGESLNPQIRRF
jgi:hypothetical protein